MGLLDLASDASYWRGYYYYKEQKVKSCNRTDINNYSGTVEGSMGKLYQVMLDLDHPKKSTCTCPHAEGNRRVCKHKVALYFSIFPEAAEKALADAEAWEAEEEQYLEDDERAEIEKYVYSLTKQELREELLWRMLEERESENGW